MYNEETNIGKCLSSIFGQEYPARLLEVLVVDGGSTDNTVRIARDFPVRILRNEKRIAAAGRLMGLQNAKNDLHVYMDADMTLPGRNWFNVMTRPMNEDSRISGSFTRFIPDEKDAPLNRYLSYNEFQHDPLLAYLSPQLKGAFVESREGYYVCKFQKRRVPLIGVILFRTPIVRKIANEFQNENPSWSWADVDFLVRATDKGQLFAYVPLAGLHHRGFPSLSVYLRKKRRDVYDSFLPALDKRAAKYVNPFDRLQAWRIILWVLYSNLVLPSLVKGLARSISHRDIALMYEPVLTLSVTNYLIALFLRHPRGRKLILTAVRTAMSAGKSFLW